MNPFFGPQGLFSIPGHPWLSAVAGVGAVAAGVCAVWLWGWPFALWVWREGAASLALGRTGDGRHALALAWHLRRAAARLRRNLPVVEQDARERDALLAVLNRFTQEELGALLARMAVLIGTGDNERIRDLQRRLDALQGRWSAAPEPERARLAPEIARLRQEQEQSRRTGRAWVRLIRGLEDARSALRSLERDLALLGLARGPQLPEARLRLGEASQRLRDLQQAHLELQQGV